MISIKAALSLAAAIPALVPALVPASPRPVQGAEAPAGDTVTTERLVTEITGFLDAEVAAHLSAVPTLNPPPALVLGVPTKGDFTWGSFMRAITDVAALTGKRAIAGRDVPETLGRLGLVEARLGGKTFSQLGAALALREFGTDLEANPLWRSLTRPERREWRELLDPGRFYDRERKQVIDLPENYFGVAARIVTMDHQMGLVDRDFADELLERAAAQFRRGALYTDDSLPTGRFDRYSQEYARFVYEAAGNVGRRDVQEAVAPSLTAVMRTWWDLVSPDGYGYPWGRTIGAIGYMDTMDIVGFLAAHPRFRPAPLSDLAGAYWAAWQWLQGDYRRDRHLLDMFGFGRGNYHYMTPERQWQQTTSFMAKAAGSLRHLQAALRQEQVASFPARPPLPAVARFESFRKGDRPAGVWLVRQGALRFALPFTTGPKAGIADYLPAPHGLPGFAVPVEQFLPALVPYLELDDGRRIVAGDGADVIEPSADGRGLHAVWRRWTVVGGPPARPVDVGLTSTVDWAIDGGTLVRKETIEAARPVVVRRFEVALPTTAGDLVTHWDGSQRFDRLVGDEARSEVVVEGSSPLDVSAKATGDSAVGRGARGPVPLILMYSAENLTLVPREPFTWIVRYDVRWQARAGEAASTTFGNR